MNLALPAITLLLILSPGFIWRMSYVSSSFSNKFSGRNFTNELIWSVIPAIFLQSIWVSTVGLFGYKIDFEIVGALLIGDSDFHPVDFGLISIQLGQILCYNLSLFSFSAVFGHTCRFFIRILGLDRRFPVLRFSNKWHYLLSGEFLDFPNIPDSYSQISYTSVDVLCDIGHENVIYIGELVDFEITSSGDLEMIQLRYPKRRSYEGKSGDYYEIPSNYLTIPSKNIVNINVRLIQYSDQIDSSEIDLSVYEIFDLDSEEVRKRND